MPGFYARQHDRNQPVLTSELRVGLPIHLSYTHNGCVWNIRSIEKPNSKGEIMLNLVSPMSNKPKRANAKYATHIRRNESPRRH